MMLKTLLQPIHPTWLVIINMALKKLPAHYLEQLFMDITWLPGPTRLLHAFSEPLEKTRYILFGESPYPRANSAIGYAFWDGAVQELWSAKGLAKTVNRATSLRNIIKMLLLAEDALSQDGLSQDNIAKLNKQHYVQTGTELFNNFLHHGFLLLNATPVLSKAGVKQDAVIWRPFIAEVLEQLYNINNKVTLILFGKVAEFIGSLPIAKNFPQLQAEHPYNLSFITNTKIIEFFKPLHLLRSSHDK